MVEADVTGRSPPLVYLIVSCTYLYALTNEFIISCTSPMLRILASNDKDLNSLGRTIDEYEQEWLASLTCLGYMAGIIPFCYLCSKIGRYKTLLSLGIIHVAGFSLFLTQNLICYYIGRFLNGVASSVGLIVFPMYISEICKDSDRGALLASRQIFAGFGTLVAFCLPHYLSIGLFHLFCLFFPISFCLMFGICGVESPYFYATNNKFEKATEVYIELSKRRSIRRTENRPQADGEAPRVRTDEQAQRVQADEEVQEIQRTLEITEAESIGDLLKQKHIQKAILIVFALFIFQQLTGYIAFAAYAEVIVGSKIATILIGILIFLSSGFTTFFVDRFGRKFHLLLSGVGVVSVHLALLIYYLRYQPKFYPLVVCICLFFLCFNLGLSFIPQIISAEILPQRIKFEVAAIAGVFSWGIAFLITKYFLQVDRVYMVSLFLVCSIIQLIIIMRYVPETKKQSLRMIQGMLQIEANQRIEE